ncbi:MAG: CaiB/BaiF CoA transferase family protein [Halioglobus sp.]
MSGPFEGVNVLDLGSMVAGPGAATVMCDQGANVIKIEPTGMGDVMRYLSSMRGGVSGLYHSVNRGKRSMCLDMKSEEGVALLQQLAEKTDVVIQNYRPGVAERLGVDYDSLRKFKPDLIYLSASGFGDSGPNRDKPAYDAIIQAFAGISQSQADLETNVPVNYYQLFADKLTALTGSQAVSAALFARERGKGGQHIKLSMIDTVVAFLWADTAGTAAFVGDGINGEKTQPGLAAAKGAKLIPFADGYGIASPVTDKQFGGYCRAFGYPDDDPRFATIADRNTNAEELISMLRGINDIAATMPVADAIAAMEAEGVPCAMAQNLEDLPDHPQFVANETFATIDNPQAGKILEPNNAPNFMGTPAPPLRPAASLGEHTNEILRELGLDDTRITQLREQQVVG